MKNSIVFLCFLLIATTADADFVIEDFEPPNESARVTSYPSEDIQPSQWRFDTSQGAGGTHNSFYIYGNSWKLYNISDYNVEINADTVWEIYVYVPVDGSVQAFGLTDGVHELRYIIEASESPPMEEPWLTEYAGYKSTLYGFARFKLPVGLDWRSRYGLTGSRQITDLIFINDGDVTTGRIYFDQISDITDSEPASPWADVGPDIAASVQEPIGFQCSVTDPDSSSFLYVWDFGDGGISFSASPVHAFDQPGLYNVLCRVEDPTNRIALDSLRVLVHEENTRVVSLLFGGDMMLARRYEDANEDGIPGNSDGSLILPGDGGLGAQNIAKFTRRAYSSLRVMNLETPLTDEGSPHPTKSITYRSRPDAVAAVTETDAGLVTVANNHLIDYMEAGLEETLEVLANPPAFSMYARQGAIPFTGGGRDIYEALQPATKAFNGLRIGFQGFCSVAGHTSNEQPFFIAGYEKPGVLYLNSANLQATISRCEELCDLTVVMLHSGIEYDDLPSPYSEQMAHEAIDYGADLVICHHPHVSQGIEYYMGVPIVYSLGNFFFDQKYQKTMMSFMVDARMDRQGCHQIRLIPAYLENYEPRFVKGDAGIRLLNRLTGLSAPLDSTVLAFDDLMLGCSWNTGLCPDPAYSAQSFNVPTSYQSTAGNYLSPVAEIPAHHYISRIDSITSVSGSKSLLCGRDLFMFGNFEDDDIDDDELEGIGWDLTPGNVSAQISDYNPHEGACCLRLRRHSSHTSRIEASSAWRMPVISGKLYAVTGWYRLVGAEDATLSVSFFYYPYTWSSGWDQETVLLGPVSGDQDWTYFCRYIYAPTNLGYANLTVGLDPPGVSGYGYVYFDQIRFIEWQENVNPMLPFVFQHPDDTRYLALKTNSPQSTPVPMMNTTLAEYEFVDSDGDGIPDMVEDCNLDGRWQPGESDVYQTDTDHDGLTDSEETIFGEDGSITCPWLADSDGDGYDDHAEFLAQTNPNDDLSHPSGPTATPSATPYFSPTPTPMPPTMTPSPPVPTPTVTRSPTPTPSNPPTATPTSLPSSTETATPTATRTSTPSPTSSPVHSETPTVTPTTSETPVETLTPSPTPTAAPATQTPTASSTPDPTNTPYETAVGLSFTVSDPVFRPGETCWIRLEILNHSISLDMDLYVILDVFGSYFCYPGWSPLDDELDFEHLHIGDHEFTSRWIIPEFTMPEADSSGPYTFYAAGFFAGHLDIESLCSNLAANTISIGTAS